MLSFLKQALSCWWTRDQVRISPWEGRLLKLQPGQRILICWQPWVVDSRSQTGNASCLVEYRLSGRTTAILRVERIGRQNQGQLQCAQSTQFVYDEDVSVLSSNEDTVHIAC